MKETDIHPHIPVLLEDTISGLAIKESGIYLDLGDIRTEINYQYIIYNSENIYNLQMHYSNSFLDVMFGKNNFNENDNLFCGIELFLNNNLSINLFSDFSANNFGISYYR